MSDILTGLPWYTRETYPRCLAIFTDADKLHDNFDDWLRAAERDADALTNRGEHVIKAFINPDTFAAWCKSYGLKCDENGRAVFANVMAKAHKTLLRHEASGASPKPDV